MASPSERCSGLMFPWHSKPFLAYFKKGLAYMPYRMVSFWEIAKKCPWDPQSPSRVLVKTPTISIKLYLLITERMGIPMNPRLVIRLGLRRERSHGQI